MDALEKKLGGLARERGSH